MEVWCEEAYRLAGVLAGLALKGPSPPISRRAARKISAGHARLEWLAMASVQHLDPGRQPDFERDELQLGYLLLHPLLDFALERVHAAGVLRQAALAVIASRMEDRVAIGALYLAAGDSDNRPQCLLRV